MKLHAIAASPPCHLVLAILEEFDIPFEYVNVNLLKGEHKTEEFLKLNPLGKLPTLQEGDWSLGESVAIQQYILNTQEYPESFYPKDHKKRAIIDSFVSFQQTSLSKTNGKIYYSELVGPLLFKAEKVSEEDSNAQKEALGKTLVALQTLKKAYGGDYLTGDDYTLADLNNWAILQNTINNDLFEFGEEHADIKAWFERVSEHKGSKAVAERAAEMWAFVKSQPKEE